MFLFFNILYLFLYRTHVKKIFFELNPFLLFIEADFLFMYLLLAHNFEY